MALLLHAFLHTLHVVKSTIDAVNERLFAMEILKKQCKELLLPKCEIKLTTKLGEGMYVTEVCTHVYY